MSTDLITAPYWGLFESDQMDLSTTEKEYTEYRELNVTNTTGLTKYEIETKDKDAFLLMHEGLLEVRYQIMQNTNPPTILTAAEDTCLQNNALSLFKNSELLCEDQRIEYCDQPYIGHTIKNLAEFSRPHGESVASNQHFFLDSCDESVSSKRSTMVRFYVVTAPRYGNEITFVQGAAFQLVPAQTIAGNIASTQNWFTGDTVIARIGHFHGPAVNFLTKAANAANSTAVVRTATLAGGTGILTFSGGAAGNTILLQTNNDNYAIKLYTIPTNIVVPGVTAAVVNTQDIEVPFMNYPVGAGTNLGPCPIVLGGTNTQPTFVTLGAANNISIAFNWQNAGAPVYAQAYANIGNVINNCYNTGFDRRVRICSTGNLVTAMIPLKNIFLFCNAFNKVTRGVRWRIVLNRESDNQVLLQDYPGNVYNIYAGANVNANARTFQLSYISCWIPRLKPNLETLKSLEAKLVSNETFDVNFTDLNVFRTPQIQIGAATNSAIQLSTTTKKPIRIWVAFQRVERVNDSQLVNKRVFDLLGTTALHVRLNGKLFPLYEYKITYNNNNANTLIGALSVIPPDSGINRAYNAFLNAGYKMHGHHDSSLIDIDTFVKFYPIFYCDLTDQDEDLFKSQKSAEIEVRWSNTLGGTNLVLAPNGYHMWVVWEAERLIKMKGVSGSLALVL